MNFEPFLQFFDLFWLKVICGGSVPDAWRRASPLVTRAAGEGKRCAPCASWSLVVGSRVGMCGEERANILPASGALFSDPWTVSGKWITFCWTYSSGSSRFVLFLNIILRFRMMTSWITRYCKSYCKKLLRKWSKEAKFPKLQQACLTNNCLKRAKIWQKRGGLFSYGKELRLSFFAGYVIILGAYE